MSDDGVMLRCITTAYEYGTGLDTLTNEVTLTVTDEPPPPEGDGFEASLTIGELGFFFGWVEDNVGSLDPPVAPPENTPISGIYTQVEFAPEPFNYMNSPAGEATGFRYLTIFGNTYMFEVETPFTWLNKDAELALLLEASNGSTVPVFIWDQGVVPS